MAAALNYSVLPKSISDFGAFMRGCPLRPFCLKMAQMGLPSIMPRQLTRLQIDHGSQVPRPRCKFHICMASELEEVNAEMPSHVDPLTVNSPEKATFDLKLPRRSLFVQFTCNACGERSKRKINRVAYERGTVFVQCSGCLQHHKLVDNLGLIIEYDLRDDKGGDENSSI